MLAVFDHDKFISFVDNENDFIEKYFSQYDKLKCYPIYKWDNLSTLWTFINNYNISIMTNTTTILINGISYLILDPEIVLSFLDYYNSNYVNLKNKVKFSTFFQRLKYLFTKRL